MNFLKIPVLTLSSFQFLRYDRLKLRGFFCFYMSIFQSIAGLNGLKKYFILQNLYSPSLRSFNLCQGETAKKFYENDRKKNEKVKSFQKLITGSQRIRQKYWKVQCLAWLSPLITACKTKSNISVNVAPSQRSIKLVL